MEKTDLGIRRPGRGEIFLPLLLIFAVSFGIYAGTLGNSFVYDDRLVVKDNHFIRSWENLPDLFTANYFMRSQELNYRPVVTLSYFLDYLLWKNSAFGYHLTNVLLHAANACLAYYFLGFLFLRRRLALISALLFALHPINSEAVCGVAFREDLLVLFFSLLSMIFYRKSARSGRENRRVFLGISLISFLLALFSKEMAIIVPVLLLLTEALPLAGGAVAERPPLRWEKYYWPYLAALAGYLLVRFHWLASPRGELVSFLGNDYYLHLLTQGTVFLSYLKLLLLPVGLSIFHPVISVDSFLHAGATFAVFILVELVLLVFYLRRTVPELAFGIAYFLITLLPVSNLIPLRNPMAERYLYLPALGYCFCLAYGLERLGSSRLRRSSPQFRRKLPAFLLISILSFYAGTTFLRSRDWKNSLILYEKVVRQYPGSSRFHANLGSEYQRQDRKPEAMSEFMNALEVDPDDPVAHVGLGLLYAQEGQFALAIQHYQAAKTVRPDFVAAYRNLGVLYYQLERYQEAVSEFQRELELSPFSAEAHNNLGRAQEKLKNFAEALSAYQGAIRLEPGNFEFNYNLANLYARLELSNEAIAGYQKALRINSENAHAHYQLGTLYAEKGKLEMAKKELENSLRLNPADARAYNNLGGICWEMGNPGLARTYFEKALNLNPDLVEARRNLQELEAKIENR